MAKCSDCKGRGEYDCNTCNGTGKQTEPDGTKTDCTDCMGKK